MPRWSEAVRDTVRQRAQARCEYCRLPDTAISYTFHIEHIIARKHHGSSGLDNLAWACLQCNLTKGADVASYDVVTGQLTPLYNPRKQAWADHFEMVGARIVGKTPEGRVTVDVLDMNASEQVQIREALIQVGRW